MDTTIVVRHDVEVNGVKYALTDEQIGEMTIECSPAELEAFKLELSRELGLPEPELYADELIGPTADESEEELDALIELQERMAKGMRMILEAQVKLERVRHELQGTRDHHVPYNEFTNLIKARSEWQTRISKMWDLWFDLQGQTKNTDNFVWVKYYQLVEGDNKYFCTGDSEDIDEQVSLFQNQNEVADVLRDTHLMEMVDCVGPRGSGMADV